LLDSRRILRGDQPKPFIERVWHRVLTQPESQSLFVSLKSRLASAKYQPPGFSFKLSLDFLDGSYRLDTGMEVQVNRAPDGSPADWQTVPVTLSFSTVKIRYQAMELDDEMLLEYNHGQVLGAEYAINAVNMDGQTPTTEVARFACTDISQQYSTVAVGSTGAQMVVNSGDKQVLPQFMAVYLTQNQNEAFTTKGFATYNWNCMSWCVPNIKTFRANTSDGSYDKPPYLEIYPNNDINLTDPGEMTIMGQNVSGQQFWRQIGIRAPSLMNQHTTMGVNTWLGVTGGYPALALPARNMVAWYLDPSTQVVRDAANGLEQSQLTVQATLTTSTTSPFAFVVSQFIKSDVVVKVDSRKFDNVTSVKPVYVLDKELSGFAFREPKPKKCKI
jgi:hypothetical protein